MTMVYLGIFLILSEVLCINYQRLMVQYFLVCGSNYFCGNVTDITGLNAVDIQTPNKICASCYCDSMCVNRGDCCADLFFSLPPLTCVNRTIIQANNDYHREQQRKRPMVSVCPEQSNEISSSMCESSDTKFKLQYPPVVQDGLPIVYRNKFCAECYNVSSFRQWGIDIDCGKFADFNFLSSLDDVIDLAFERECNIQATDENVLPSNNTKYDDYNVEICIEDPIQFSRCNLTGAWQTYDEDIKLACESTFLGRHRMFRNIFCFMCNPSPGEFKTVIDTCNVTGSWRPFEQGLQTMCKDLPSSSYTLPFKNVHCYLCNNNNYRNESFLEVDVSLEEAFVTGREGKMFQYIINISSFNTDFFLTSAKKKIFHEPFLNEPIKTKDPGGIISRDGLSVNMSNLFSQYVSTFDGIGLCSSRTHAVASQFLLPCNCDPFCVFTDLYYPKYKCCLDALIDYPTSCRSELDLSGKPDPRKIKYNDLVVNGCFQENTRSIIFQGCTNRNISDIFSVLPLNMNVSLDQTITLITYDNLYCALCNLNYLSYIMQLNQTLHSPLLPTASTIDEDLHSFESEENVIWDLEIVCPHILPISYALILGDLLRIANDTQCRIRYVRDVNQSPNNCHDYGPDNTVLSSHCDLIGNWTFPDKDIKWACLNQSSLLDHLGADMLSPAPSIFDPNDFINYRAETFQFFRNKFCSICSPTSTLGNLTDVISSCNETKLLYQVFPITADYFDYNSKRCKSARQTYYFYPFKNIYCARCNGMVFGEVGSPGYADPIPGYIKLPGVNWFPILRNMFSVRGESSYEEQNDKLNCNNDQVYDALQERCRNKTCFPGKNLMNSSCIPLLTTTKRLRYTLATGADIQSINMYISTEDLIRNMIHERSKILTEAVGVDDLTIEHAYGYIQQPCTDIIGHDTNISIQMYLIIFIQKSVHRGNVEASLIKAKNTVVFANTSANFYTLNSAEMLPLMMLRANRCGTNCFVYQNSDKVVEPYRAVRISETLLCPFVGLKKNEFFVDENNGLVYLKRNHRVLLEGYYDMERSNEIYVCTEELDRVGFFNASSNLQFTDEKTLWYISITFTSVSCFCLVLSILTYFLLPTLRTLPGKINIVTMTTLLFTLLFNQSGFLFVSSDTGCIVFGGCLHYIWLCVFTTMQISNYHMNRVFASTVLVVQGYTKGILLKYFGFSFLIPLILVLINMLYSYTVTQGDSFGYGGVKCFILQRELIIFTFIVPVGLTISLNLILFVWTSVTILRSPKVQNNKRNRGDFLVILKMSSITGVCWITQVIDSFFALSEFSYVPTILVNSQGILIFLAFIANSRVLHMYKTKYSSFKFYSGTDTTRYELSDRQ